MPRFDPKDILAAIAGQPQLLALLPEILKALPAILALIERFAPERPGIAGPGPRPVPPIEEEPIVAPVKPIPTPETKVFTSSRLDVMDVNGEPYNPLNAIGWGSYIRLDSNPKDQFGSPLPAEQIRPETGVVEKIEWRSTWDGEADTEENHHENVGGRLYNESNGYAISCKVFKENEDARRHSLDVWVTYHLKDGRKVDSNEVRLLVD